MKWPLGFGSIKLLLLFVCLSVCLSVSHMDNVNANVKVRPHFAAFVQILEGNNV